MARQDPFEAGAASRNWGRSERDGAGEARSTAPDAGVAAAGPFPLTPALSLGEREKVRPRFEEVAGRLQCALEEWEAAHRACLDVDEDFAHELAQIQFAMGCVRLSWCKKHPTALGINAGKNGC